MDGEDFTAEIFDILFFAFYLGDGFVIFTDF